MLVFDASAIVALFDAYTPVYNVWRTADRGLSALAFPSAAMVEAGRRAAISETAWDPVLWSPSISVLPLGEAAATQLGAWTGSLAMGHTIWESRATGWPVLTCIPEDYGDGVEIFAV